MTNETERGDQVCNEDDGCPTEIAVLKRQWREYRRALINLRAGMVGAKNSNIVDYIDAVLTPNDRVEGRDAASSRRVPSHDWLCGNGNYNERTDK